MPPRPQTARLRARRCAAAPLAVLALLGASACSHEDPAAVRAPRSEAASPTSTVAYEQWRSTLDATCSELNTRYAALRDAQPTTAQDAVDYAAQVDRFVQAIAVAVDAGGVPGDRRDEVDDLHSRLEEMSTATRALSRAAAAGDTAAASSAVTDVRSIATSVDPLATTLGVPACGGF